jgi:hypothetical protein
MSVGRLPDAEAATVTLGLQLAEIRKEGGAATATEMAKHSFKQQAKALWAKDVRFRTFFGMFLMAMQQVCTT